MFRDPGSSRALGPIALGFALALGAARVGATPLDAGGPIVSNDAHGPELTLQAILDQMTGAPGEIDAIADRSTASLFHSAWGMASFTLSFEFSEDAPLNQFGIYSAGDPTLLAEIFSGGHHAVMSRSVTFFEDGSIRIGSQGADGRLIRSFGNEFGFFLGNPRDQSVIYSDDQLNDGASAAAVFRGDNQTLLQTHPSLVAELFRDSEFLLVFGGPGGGPDPAHVVIRISNLAATEVAEPSTALLLGLGILTLGTTRHAGVVPSAPRPPTSPRTSPREWIWKTPAAPTSTGAEESRP